MFVENIKPSREVSALAVKHFHQRGFTLIELVISIAIMGILCSMIIPDFNSTFENYKLELAAKRLVQDIYFIRQTAISERKYPKIVFDVLNTQDNYVIKVDGFGGKKVTLPKGVFLKWTNFTDSTITFAPSGAPNGGTIAITNNKKSLYVIVSPVTGHVRIGNVPPD